MADELDDYALIEFCDEVIEVFQDRADGEIMCRTAWQVRSAALGRIEADRRIGPVAVTLLLGAAAVILFLVARGLIALLP